MIYAFDDMTLDTQRLTLHQAGQTIRLRPKVFQVLLYLLEHRDRVVDKQELSEQMWPDQFISDATLGSTVREVRRAIGDNPREHRMIQTFHGYGYRFVAPETQVSETLASPERPQAPKQPVAEATWQCGTCQHRHPVYDPDIARFCVACGAPRQTECPQCGMEALPQARFCAACGTALVISSDPPAPSATPPHDSSCQPDITAPTPQAPDSERRQITVLCCDVVESTALSNQMDLELQRRDAVLSERL